MHRDVTQFKRHDAKHQAGMREMTKLSIQSNSYFNPATHQALRLRAASSQVSMSALVNVAVGQMMHEDQEDLAAFAQRADESETSRKVLLANLKRRGKFREF